MANQNDEKKNSQNTPEGTTDTGNTGGAPDNTGGAPDPGSGDDKKQTPAKKADKPKKKKYTLPRNVLSDAKHHTVIFNGKAYQIECGKEVEIPVGVAEVLDNALAQKEAANELEEELKAEK